MEFLKNISTILHEQNPMDPLGMDDPMADPAGQTDEFNLDLSQGGEDTIEDDDIGDQFSGDEAQANLDQPPENLDRQGLIRKVDGAHLVYKRQDEEGTYEELWIYNVNPNDYQDSMNTRKAILAGTDIPPGQTESEDGSQMYDIWTAGNAELLKITGMPN